MNSTDLSIQLSLELQVKLRRASFIASLSFVKKKFWSPKKTNENLVTSNYTDARSFFSIIEYRNMQKLYFCTSLQLVKTNGLRGLGSN